MRKYITATIEAVAVSLLWGGIITLALRYLVVPLIVRLLDQPGRTVVIAPRGGMWWWAWAFVSTVHAVMTIPKDLLRARRVATRSRRLGAFVLWRRAGRYQLHHPEGGVVPVDAYRLTGGTNPGDVQAAQAVAEQAITRLTGRNVARWEPDKVSRSLSADSSWIAHLADGTEAPEPPRSL